jgi:hypothetical protein
MVKRVTITNPIWIDKGKGGKYQAAVWRLHASNSFVVTPDRAIPQQLLDINPNATCH